MPDTATDLDRFVDLYRGFGVDCVVNITTPAQAATKWGAPDERPAEDQEPEHPTLGAAGVRYIILADDDIPWYDPSAVTVSRKFRYSYSGFYSLVRFTAEGAFMDQAFFE